MTEESQAALALSQANADEKAVYEVGFHVLPTIAESEVGGVVEKVRNELSKFETEIIKEEFPHKMTFSYTIERSVSGKREKYSEGYFGWIKFETQPMNIPQLQEALRAMKEVLRFIVVETVREEAVSPRRAIFSSDRLEGETIKKPTAAPERAGEVSEEELDKSIEALVQ